MDEDDFVKMVEDLQKKIEYEEEATYSQIVITEYRKPTNFGVLEHPDAVGMIKGPCSDTMKITLRIKDGLIKDARFWTDGCGASIACGNMLMKMVTGKTIENAVSITSKKLTDELGGLPKEHIHCTVLTVNTLHEAVKHYNRE